MIYVFLPLSWLPFFVLHGLSDVLYFLIFYVFRYRRQVVHENISRAFPDKSDEWVHGVERQFYKNFCDVMVETIKTTSLAPAELAARCKFVGRENANQMTQGKNIAALSSHLANWEWLGLSTSMEIKQTPCVIYKPLKNQKMNNFMLKTRSRFGLVLIAMKDLKRFFEQTHEKPYLLGFLSDQAPHDYAKAFSVPFLNQQTYYFTGPGVITVKHNLFPIWGWMRRVGRSRFEWGMDEVIPDESYVLTKADLEQIGRVAKLQNLTEQESEKAFRIVREYSRLLEEKIKAAPADWLWSHRRWKAR